MGSTFTIQWDEYRRSFTIRADRGSASLPALPPSLDAELDVLEQHLQDHFTVAEDDVVSTGHWSSEEARQWFVTQARRIERELPRVMPRARGVIKVSAFPSVIPIRFFNDYGWWPLWTLEGGTGPEDFPMLSDGLRDDLIAWSQRHKTGDIRTKGGPALLRRVQEELGPAYEVE